MNVVKYFIVIYCISFIQKGFCQFNIGLNYNQRGIYIFNTWNLGKFAYLKGFSVDIGDREPNDNRVLFNISYNKALFNNSERQFLIKKPTDKYYETEYNPSPNGNTALSPYDLKKFDAKNKLSYLSFQVKRLWRLNNNQIPKIHRHFIGFQLGYSGVFFSKKIKNSEVVRKSYYKESINFVTTGFVYTYERKLTNKLVLILGFDTNISLPPNISLNCGLKYFLVKG